MMASPFFFLRLQIRLRNVRWLTTDHRVFKIRMLLTTNDFQNNITKGGQLALTAFQILAVTYLCLHTGCNRPGF